MENVVNTLHIQNFKSIRSVILHPRRVNLVIGQPNVGKSTLLEAMSLLGSLAYEQKKKFMGSFIRYEKAQHLFHDNIVSNIIKVETDRDVCLLGRNGQTKNYQYASFSQETYRGMGCRLATLPGSSETLLPANDGALLNGLCAQLATPPANLLGYQYAEFDRYGLLNEAGFNGPCLASAPPWQPRAVKPYRFRRNTKMGERRVDSTLFPPYGDNLVHVLEAHPDLRQEFAALFAAHGLKLRVRVDAGRFEVVKEIDGISYAYPYSCTGDTLQRFGFYLAVLESNQRSVILLEEPEAHSYPTYITELGKRIATSQGNQFFVTTHSPYLVTEVLENMVPYERREPELAVFVAYYQNFETKVRQLSDDEVRCIRRNSIDVFHSLNKFVQHAATQSEQTLRANQLAALRGPGGHAIVSKNQAATD
jgi:predicted ATPase